MSAKNENTVPRKNATFKEATRTGSSNIQPTLNLPLTKKLGSYTRPCILGCYLLIVIVIGCYCFGS